MNDVWQATHERPMCRLARVDLLVLHDCCLQGFSAEGRHDLLEITEARQARECILIASQVPVESWPEVIGEMERAEPEKTAVTARPRGSRTVAQGKIGRVRHRRRTSGSRPCQGAAGTSGWSWGCRRMHQLCRAKEPEVGGRPGIARGAVRHVETPPNAPYYLFKRR